MERGFWGVSLATGVLVYLPIVIVPELRALTPLDPLLLVIVILKGI